ncbi:unnamed protein product, partial [Notodromas monacha]
MAGLDEGLMDVATGSSSSDLLGDVPDEDVNLLLGELYISERQEEPKLEERTIKFPSLASELVKTLETADLRTWKRLVELCSVVKTRIGGVTLNIGGFESLKKICCGHLTIPTPADLPVSVKGAEISEGSSNEHLEVISESSDLVDLGPSEEVERIPCIPAVVDEMAGTSKGQTGAIAGLGDEEILQFNLGLDLNEGDRPFRHWSSIFEVSKFMPDNSPTYFNNVGKSMKLTDAVFKELKSNQVKVPLPVPGTLVADFDFSTANGLCLAGLWSVGMDRCLPATFEIGLRSLIGYLNKSDPDHVGWRSVVSPILYLSRFNNHCEARIGGITLNIGGFESLKKIWCGHLTIPTPADLPVSEKGAEISEGSSNEHLEVISESSDLVDLGPSEQVERILCIPAVVDEMAGTSKDQTGAIAGLGDEEILQFNLGLDLNEGDRPFRHWSSIFEVSKFMPDNSPTYFNNVRKSMKLTDAVFKELKSNQVKVPLPVPGTLVADFNFSTANGLCPAGPWSVGMDRCLLPTYKIGLRSLIGYLTCIKKRKECPIGLVCDRNGVPVLPLTPVRAEHYVGPDERMEAGRIYQKLRSLIGYLNKSDPDHVGWRSVVSPILYLSRFSKAASWGIDGNVIPGKSPFEEHIHCGSNGPSVFCNGMESFSVSKELHGEQGDVF